MGGGDNLKYYNREREILTGFYYGIAYIIGDDEELDLSKVEFSSLVKKKQRKIRKYIDDFYAENKGDLSDETNEQILPDNKFDDIFSFLKKVKHDANEDEKLRIKDWDEVLSDFDDQIKKAVISQLDAPAEFNLFSDAENINNMIKCDITQGDSFVEHLYFINPIFSENYNPEWWQTDAEISKTDDGYMIEFMQKEYDENSGCIVNESISYIKFSDLRLEIKCFNYTKTTALDYKPWNAIYTYLSSLVWKKEHLGIKFLNEKEKKLLPLIEFAPLNEFYYVNNYVETSHMNKAAAKLFISFAEEVGNQKIVDLTQKYLASQNKKQEKKFSKKILVKLNKVESEPLYRLILAEIQDAAAEYPTRVEQEFHIKEVEKLRKNITTQMHKDGFEGEYPNFKKMSPLKGMRLMEINGQSCLVTNEKHMVSCIKCSEDMLWKRVVFSYAVSTIFLKKRQLHLYDSLDGDSGFFIDKYRRRARDVSLNYHSTIHYSTDIDDSALQECLDVAIKVSKCDKLTKQEREDFVSTGVWSIPGMNYSWLFVLMGVAFGIVMMMAMFLLCLITYPIIAPFSPEAPPFSEFIHFLAFDIPWGPLGLFSTIAFGASMAIFTAISNKRG